MKIFRFDVKKAIPFIEAIISKFNNGYYMSLVGVLSAVELQKIKNSNIHREIGITSPFDRVVFPLSQENIQILKGLLPNIGIRNRITEIFVEKDGNIIFASYDYLYKGDVWISAVVGEEFIKHLLNERIIRKYWLDEIPDAVNNSNQNW